MKAVNPAVAGVLYLNTLLDFPFYSLHGEYERENVVAMDSVTKAPIQIRNDNGLEGIFVFGFDHPVGQQLYIDAVRNLTSSGPSRSRSIRVRSQLTAQWQWQLTTQRAAGRRLATVGLPPLGPRAYTCHEHASPRRRRRGRAVRG